MGKLYTYQVFNNTAGSQGRSCTKSDLEDVYTAQIECDNDYEAFEAVYLEIFPDGNPYSRDYIDAEDFPTVEDYIEFFKEMHQFVEVPLLLYLRQGNRILFDLEAAFNTSLEELLGIYEDDEFYEYDDEDEYED